MLVRRYGREKSHTILVKLQSLPSSNESFMENMAIASMQVAICHRSQFAQNESTETWMNQKRRFHTSEVAEEVQHSSRCSLQAMTRTAVHHIHSRMMHQRMHVSETLWKFDFQITLENSFILVFVLTPQP